MDKALAAESAIPVATAPAVVPKAPPAQIHSLMDPRENPLWAPRGQVQQQQQQQQEAVADRMPQVGADGASFERNPFMRRRDLWASRDGSLASTSAELVKLAANDKESRPTAGLMSRLTNTQAVE